MIRLRRLRRLRPHQPMPLRWWDVTCHACGQTWQVGAYQGDAPHHDLAYHYDARARTDARHNLEPRGPRGMIVVRDGPPAWAGGVEVSA